ncbi:uncharacterized protein [Rutidosis leptorrhynchoides]|uniref:uncharacterized protein n=1 Tax=Rutidosis leptorrhynchoides TaxID=125765 RepID=UPI003A990F50
MDEVYVVSKNLKTHITNQHYFKVDVFTKVLDMIIQEFGNRFSEVSTELLTNTSALSPRNLFSRCGAYELMKLSEMFHMDFNQAKRDHLKRELDIYYVIVHRDERFAYLNGISNLARLMVETEKHIYFGMSIGY